MEQQPTLIVLAAGMGSRFGGLKQISPLGPNGEIIADYSLHDAYAAGFRHVVFVIKEEMLDTFKEVIGDRAAQTMQVSYAFQSLDKLPAGFTAPPDRVKPYGTAHAVLCAAPHITGNFGIINADDFYGADCYKKLYDFLKQAPETDPMELCMVAYVLRNTLTENGTVSRGVCQVEDGKLITVTERTSIAKDGEHARFVEAGNSIPIDGGTPVSMNVWGFTKGMLQYMEAGFVEFLQDPSRDPLKGEYYLPLAVDNAIQDGKARVTVLSSADKWYGVTYAEDKDSVSAALKHLHDRGKYSNLR